MKKFLSLLFVVMMLSTCVAQASIDISGLTYDELVDLKVKVNNAISAYDNVTTEQEIWYDDNDVRITCTKYGITTSYSGGYKLCFDFIIENNSDRPIRAGITDDYANGWAVGTHGNFCDNSLAAGKKMKSTQDVYLNDCDINSADDLAEYEFVFWIDLDEESWDNERLEFERRITVFPAY